MQTLKNCLKIYYDIFGIMVLNSNVECYLINTTFAKDKASVDTIKTNDYFDVYAPLNAKFNWSVRRFVGLTRKLYWFVWYA